MISASDVLQIIGEIHQYSMLLLELKDSATFGILHSSSDKLSYFKYEGRLERDERASLVENVSGGRTLESLTPLPVDQFLREIEGKKPRHIWLETVAPNRRELGFLSVSELKTFLRTGKSH